MAYIKVFFLNFVKGHDQVHVLNIYGTSETHVPNMKTLSLRIKNDGLC